MKERLCRRFRRKGNSVSTIEDSKTLGTTVSIECPQCKVNTKHTVERALGWSKVLSASMDVQAWATYQIVRCNGCDTLSFRSTHRMSEDWDCDEQGNPVLNETEKLYPERPNRSLTDELYLHDEVYQVPKIIRSIYRETLSAVQHDLLTLAGIGIRSVIEATCVHLKAKSRNLEDKIDELVTMSLLTPDGANILHGIRLLGNAAAHKIEAPTTRQISAALKVIDHLLLGAFVIPEEASILPKPESHPANNTANGGTKGKYKPYGEGDE